MRYVPQCSGMKPGVMDSHGGVGEFFAELEHRPSGSQKTARRSVVGSGLVLHMVTMRSLRSVYQGHASASLGSAGRERMWQPMLTAILEDISVRTNIHIHISGSKWDSSVEKCNKAA